MRPQVTLKALALSTTFLGAGIGCFFAAMNAEHSWPLWMRFLALLQYLASGPLVGAGIFVLFARARWGAYAGFLALIVGTFTWVGIAYGWDDALRGMHYVAAFTFLGVVFMGIAVIRFLRSSRHRTGIVGRHDLGRPLPSTIEDLRS